MSDALSIDLWADVLCPFCYLGSQRLARAVAQFDHDVEVTHRAELSALASEVGVADADDLWRGDAFVAGVRTDEADAYAFGITGVPAFLIDQRLMVLGAQGADDLVLILVGYERDRRNSVTVIEIHHANSGRVSPL